MSENTTGLNDNLRLGIAAAQAGRHLEARRCLATVLAQAPDNIPALFWLAYASDSPQESLRLLNRVLGHYGLSLGDWASSVYTVHDGKGGTAVVQDVGTLWQAAEELAGRPLDPLDLDLIATLESHVEG